VAGGVDLYALYEGGEEVESVDGHGVGVMTAGTPVPEVTVRTTGLSYYDRGYVFTVIG
jgi:hypothetical protein